MELYVERLESISPGINGIFEQVPLELVIIPVVAHRKANKHPE